MSSLASLGAICRRKNGQTDELAAAHAHICHPSSQVLTPTRSKGAATPLFNARLQVTTLPPMRLGLLAAISLACAACCPLEPLDWDIDSSLLSCALSGFSRSF